MSSTMIEQELVDIARELGPDLRSNARRADDDGRLPATSVEAMRDAGFFRMFVPRSLGGLEVDPMTHARVQEELSRHDSAAGWMLQAAGAGAWWCSRLPAETAQEIFGQDPDRLLAVAFAFPYEGEPADGGLRLSGQRPFASNVSDADWIWVTALTIENGEPVTVDGAPVVRACFLPSADAKIVPTWDTLGMRGSDSNDVSLDGVVVPLRRSFRIGLDHSPGPDYDGLLYRAPAMLILAAYTPMVALGLARDAIDELIALAPGKTPFSSTVALADRSVAQAKLAQAEGLVRSARAYLYDRIDACWQQTVSGAEITLEDRSALLLACVQAVSAAAQAVELVFTAAGTSAIFKESRLEQHLRDAFTIRQQGFVSESRFETVGQVALGRPPELAFVAL